MMKYGVDSVDTRDGQSGGSMHPPPPGGGALSHLAG